MRTVKEIKDLMELLELATENAEEQTGRNAEVVKEMRLVRDWLGWVVKEEPLYHNSGDLEAFVENMAPLKDVLKQLIGLENLFKMDLANNETKSKL